MIKKKDETTKSPPEKTGDSPEPENLDNLEQALTRFATTFETSAKRWEQTIYPFVQSFEASAHRWERMVYPAIIVFGILGLSGFWLIYSLTTDVHELARNVDPKMERNLAAISDHMVVLSENIDIISKEIVAMVKEVKGLNAHIGHMDSSILVMQEDIGGISTKLDTLPPLLVNIAEMNHSMKAITANTGIMTRDMGVMNQNVGRPMSFMNSFAPW